MQISKGHFAPEQYAKIILALLSHAEVKRQQTLLMPDQHYTVLCTRI